MNILVDTNVLLDYLTKREPFFNNSEKIISMCACRKLRGYIAAHSIMNSFYILRKKYSPEERRNMLLQFFDVFSIVGIDELKIRKSFIDHNFKDIEDCLQAECAVDCIASYVVTRNIKDFSASIIPPITPDDFLRLYVV